MCRKLNDKVIVCEKSNNIHLDYEIHTNSFVLLVPVTCMSAQNEASYAKMQVENKLNLLVDSDDLDYKMLLNLYRRFQVLNSTSFQVRPTKELSESFFDFRMSF